MFVGRTYQSIQESVLEKLFRINDKMDSYGLQKIIADDKFREGNCQNKKLINNI